MTCRESCGTVKTLRRCETGWSPGASDYYHTEDGVLHARLVSSPLFWLIKECICINMYPVYVSKPQAIGQNVNTTPIITLHRFQSILQSSQKKEHEPKNTKFDVRKGFLTYLNSIPRTCYLLAGQFCAFVHNKKKTRFYIHLFRLILLDQSKLELYVLHTTWFVAYSCKCLRRIAGCTGRIVIKFFHNLQI